MSHTHRSDNSTHRIFSHCCVLLSLFMSAIMPSESWGAEKAAVKIEPGVSLQLAQHRARTISQISYRLGFVVPQAKRQPVEFADTISFVYTPLTTTKGKPEDPIGFQLDFQGRLSATSPLVVNGKAMKEKDFVYSDEHICLPYNKLKKGHNTIIVRGQSLDDKLNRQDDYLYTLFVPAGARSAFPCFDQPDLKACFHLSLTLPDGWRYVSSEQGDKYPIPTYLFSFTAGRFQEATAQRSGRTLRALYRETDPAKVAQLPRIFDEVDLSIRWMEQYTGIAYPFLRYEMALLPGYQFGGMEHPGAIQYKERTMFLQQGATEEDQLKRTELIAHETAHMWFGDMVTMQWFDDVWTKEVYANFMAEKVSRQLYPEVNRKLNFLKSYQLTAIATDRTLGTHPIQQPLDNLQHAGLLYGNIIYDKAPVMMQKLEEQMGQQALQQGLRAYLRKYAYRNATWDNLIHVLDSVAPEAGLPAFSSVWVKEKGMPVIAVTTVGSDSLQIAQHDPWGRGLVWPQTFSINVGYADGTEATLLFATERAVERVALPLPGPSYVIPSPDGSGYARFLLSRSDADTLMLQLRQSREEKQAAGRLAGLSMLYDQWLMHRLEGEQLALLCLDKLEEETNSLVFSQTTSYLSRVMTTLPAARRQAMEQRVYALSASPGLSSARRQQLKRAFYASFTSPQLLDSVYQVWTRHADSQFTERHYTSMAYLLAIHRPAEWQQILAVQRARLKTVDEQREFDFISRACTPSSAERQQLFDSLREVANRRVEPWARGLLSLLCHESRGTEPVRYLQPGLDLLPEIQQTGDIFFPSGWLTALLASQRSAEARSIVKAWLGKNEAAMMPSLINKVKERAFFLLNE